MLKKVGLTGNIGCGKTTVTWMFGELGLPTIEADKLANNLLAPKGQIWTTLFNRYGKQILLDRGIIGRKALAKIVFADESELRFLESLLYPKIRKEIEDEVAHLHNNGHKVAIIEVPLLFEHGWDKEVDCTIVVTCPVDVAINRCEEYAKMTRTEVEQRLKFQLPLEEKIKRATYVIDNSGSLDETNKQVMHLHKELIKEAPEKHEKSHHKMLKPLTKMPPRSLIKKKGSNFPG